MNKQEQVEKAATILKQKQVEHGEASFAEQASFEAMNRQPSGVARIEWMRRLRALNNAMVMLEEAENLVKVLNELPADVKLVEPVVEEPAPSVQ